MWNSYKEHLEGLSSPLDMGNGEWEGSKMMSTEGLGSNGAVTEMSNIEKGILLEEER